jgi:multidrug efflux system membrane fusion protein
MTTELTLRSDPVPAVLLPRSIVALNAAGELGIRTVGDDNRVGFHPIDLIDDTPEGLYLAGIPRDARVIVSGQGLVKDGDEVNAVAADEETAREIAGELAEAGEAARP